MRIRSTFLLQPSFIGAVLFGHADARPAAFSKVHRRISILFGLHCHRLRRFLTGVHLPLGCLAFHGLQLLRCRSGCRRPGRPGSPHRRHALRRRVGVRWSRFVGLRCGLCRRAYADSQCYHYRQQNSHFTPLMQNAATARLPPFSPWTHDRCHTAPRLYYVNPSCPESTRRGCPDR